MNTALVFSIILGILLLSVVALLTRLSLLKRHVWKKEHEIIALYKEKIDKIPAFIEIMSKNTAHKDIFLEMTHLHKVAIISNITSIYDLLENNSRIHREFLFLMKVSVRMQNLHKNGNFLYIRDFIIFYENTIAREILFLNSEIEHYNNLLQKKDFTILGLLFPLKKIMKTSY